MGARKVASSLSPWGAQNSWPVTCRLSQVGGSSNNCFGGRELLSGEPRVTSALQHPLLGPVGTWSVSTGSHPNPTDSGVPGSWSTPSGPQFLLSVKGRGRIFDLSCPAACRNAFLPQGAGSAGEAV